MRDFALERYFSKWEFKARYHMTASDMQSMSVGELLALADIDPSIILNQHLGYTETWGMPELRTRVADTYDAMSAENILCFSGAEEGVYSAMRVLLQPQDHAIVIVPNYQAAETIPLDICDVSGVALDPLHDWQLDINNIRASIKPNTRLISINFPNNPTGKVITRSEFDELITLCREHDLYLFSDEVYRLLELEPHKRLPQAADVYENAFSLNVMSKAYGLPGLRIGWVASQNTEILQKMERYKHYLSICNSATSENLANIALGIRDKILDKNRALILKNINLLDAFFAEFSELFEWKHPDGGCIAYPKYKGDDGVELFCQRMVSDAGVLLLPSSIYRSELMNTPQNHFRIGFGRTLVPNGIEAMRTYLRSQ